MNNYLVKGSMSLSHKRSLEVIDEIDGPTGIEIQRLREPILVSSPEYMGLSRGVFGNKKRLEGKILNAEKRPAFHSVQLHKVDRVFGRDKRVPVDNLGFSFNMQDVIYVDDDALWSLAYALFPTVYNIGWLTTMAVIDYGSKCPHCWHAIDLSSVVYSPANNKQDGPLVLSYKITDISRI